MQPNALLGAHAFLIVNCIACSRDAVLAILLAAAGGAGLAHPDGIEMLDGTGHQLWIRGQDARLEIAALRAFHAQRRSRQVRRPDVGRLQVHDDELEMHPRTHHPLQVGGKDGVLVEIRAERRPGLLRMDQPHIHPTLQQRGQHPQQRHRLPPLLHIHVLNIRRPNPQLPLHTHHPLHHLPVVKII